MKYIQISSALALVLLCLSCSGKVDRPDAILSQDQIDRINAQNTTTPTTGAVLHYICPNGHSQGADAAGVCPECGDDYVHNQAFHNDGTPPTPINNTPATNTPNVAGVFHYTCPNGHPGSSSAGACAQCGSELVHNQAFHNTTAPSAGDPASSTSIQVPPAATSAEPAQNAAGVWHYTCPSGHAGGAGGASACSQCGATLVHNSAYHN